MKVEAVKTWEDLKKLKHAFYGPTGPVAKLKQKLKNASPVEKPTLGKKLQKLVADQEKKFAAIVKNLTQQAIDERIKTESVDIGSPTAPLGSLHPLTLVANRARQWLLAQGYFETVGSAVESDEFNFERLSIPADHPSREMHDTLYLDKSNLLRTHNTSLSAREMALRPNQSFAQFSIGSVYRNDVDDATHSHQFLQLDLVNVGPYGLPELIWTLQQLVNFILEGEFEIRLRPSYFPFTSPSLEMDIKIGPRWVEVLGAGLIARSVFDQAGYQTNQNGFAAGIGLDRVAMVKYQIPDIREFYKNDLRFLSQFRGVEKCFSR